MRSTGNHGVSWWACSYHPVPTDHKPRLLAFCFNFFLVVWRRCCPGGRGTAAPTVTTTATAMQRASRSTGVVAVDVAVHVFEPVHANPVAPWERGDQCVHLQTKWGLHFFVLFETCFGWDVGTLGIRH